MAWDGPERRNRIVDDTGDRRREDDIERMERELDAVQNELRALKRIPFALAKLTSLVERLERQVDKLMESMLARFDGLDGKADKITSWKTLFGYIAAILVPILVALIGAYAISHGGTGK